MTVRWLIAAMLLLLGRPALAQAPPPGLEIARALDQRVVRVLGRTLPGVPGLYGYGLVVGEQPGPGGAPDLVVIVPDHLVRDPEHPGAVFEPPAVGFAADPRKAEPARLRDQHLPGDEGDFAILLAAKPPGYMAPPAVMADQGGILPGAAVWQAAGARARGAEVQPGRFAYQDHFGWLLFEGLDTGPGAAGAMVTSGHGVVGMMVGAAASDAQLARVVPLAFVALRVRAWGYDWNIPGETERLNRAATPPPPPAAAGPGAFALAPMAIVPLLPAEVAARSSWTPRGAGVSPWPSRPAPIYSSPRVDSPRVGTLPAGQLLPGDLLQHGAYPIIHKLDGGAWFEIETGGQPLGYVPGADVVEVWPPLATAGLTGGKVVQEWTAAGGTSALLRDVKTSYEIETAVSCAAAACPKVFVFTPPPPSPGAVVPTFQMAPLEGNWRRDDIVRLRLGMPRALVESKGVRLMACVGRADDCQVVQIYPPPAH